MIGNEALGIVFANAHDELIPELTEKRSMASVPIGGRYRMIDFSLSNLVNAGINKVGILTTANYRSLMDHLGSGKAWDLDRKTGGIFIMPPFSNTHYGVSKGHVDALAGILTFLNRSREEYAVLCDADVISNIDIEKMIETHIESGADVTVAYKHGTLPQNDSDTLVLTLNGDVVTDGALGQKTADEVDFSLDIFVLRRETLIEWISDASRRALPSFSGDVILPRIKSGRINGFKAEGFAEVLDSMQSYRNINRMLLDRENRKLLFNAQRPVYTKTRDDMPTRYGLSSVAENCLIADGCLIEGTVRNSIIFRGVTVGKGAVVEDSVLMQGTKIGANVTVANLTADKGATVTAGAVIKGTAEKNVFIGKEKVI